MKKEFPPLPKKELEKEEILNANIENNKVIYEHLEKFREVNNLKKEDIVVLGSACASYMQYLAITHFKDIDVYTINFKNLLEMQEIDNIDLVNTLVLPCDYNERLIEKDGYKFISDIDFLLSTTYAVLWRPQVKETHLIYSKLMVQELGLSKNEFKELIIKSLDKFPEDIEFRKYILLNQLYLIDELYVDIFPEEAVDTIKVNNTETVNIVNVQPLLNDSRKDVIINTSITDENELMESFMS